jgi:ankyrin repeat protein
VNHRAKSNAYSALNYFITFWGETPLHVAAVCGDREMIEVLLAAGAGKTIATTNGKTPLDYAEQYQRPEEIRNLLKENLNGQSHDKRQTERGI